MIYVGVDLHLRFCYMTVLDASGAKLQQGRVPNDAASLCSFFKGLKNPGQEEEKILVAVEACGFWCAFVDGVAPLVERVVLVHPAKVKAIASAKLKNDRVDSQTLAQLLRADLLPEAWQADVATRDLRELLRLRIALAEDRTRYKNQIHAVLHLHGERAPVSDLFGRSGREWLESRMLRPAAQQALHTSLRMVDQLDHEVQMLDRQLRERAQQDPGRALSDDHSRHRSFHRAGAEGRDRRHPSLSRQKEFIQLRGARAGDPPVGRAPTQRRNHARRIAPVALGDE